MENSLLYEIGILMQKLNILQMVRLCLKVQCIYFFGTNMHRKKCELFDRCLVVCNSAYAPIFETKSVNIFIMFFIIYI
ncbi:unnamed protein product [Larinioides sclopetarius]|uniref:Uncharacterized protein n=1 Tax=Larinioides sclopetarius TaxID=280406 RepID=A0AAV1ZCZ4_9ARAC